MVTRQKSQTGLKPKILLSSFSSNHETFAASKRFGNGAKQNNLHQSNTQEILYRIWSITTLWQRSPTPFTTVKEEGDLSQSSFVHTSNLVQALQFWIMGNQFTSNSVEKENMIFLPIIYEEKTSDGSDPLHPVAHYQAVGHHQVPTSLLRVVKQPDSQLLVDYPLFYERTQKILLLALHTFKHHQENVMSSTGLVKMGKILRLKSPSLYNLYTAACSITGTL